MDSLIGAGVALSTRGRAILGDDGIQNIPAAAASVIAFLVIVTYDLPAPSANKWLLICAGPGLLSLIVILLLPWLKPENHLINPGDEMIDQRVLKRVTNRLSASIFKRALHPLIRLDVWP